MSPSSWPQSGGIGLVWMLHLYPWVFCHPHVTGGTQPSLWAWGADATWAVPGCWHSWQGTTTPDHWKSEGILFLQKEAASPECLSAIAAPEMKQVSTSDPESLLSEIPPAATGSPGVSPLSVLPAAKKPTNLKSAGDAIRRSRLAVKKEPETKERGELWAVSFNHPFSIYKARRQKIKVRCK